MGAATIVKRGRPLGSKSKRKSRGTMTTKRYSYVAKPYNGKIVKFKPRVDNVVTRTFKYIFRTDEATQFVYNTDCFIGNVKDSTFSRAYFFNSAEIPGLNAFVGPTAPFVSYRVDEITYRFIAVGTTVIVDDTDNGTTVQIQKTQPMVYWAIDDGSCRQGETLFNSEDQAIFDCWKSTKAGNDFKIKFTPNTLTYMQSQRETSGNAITNPVLVPKRNVWLGDRFSYQQTGSPIGTNFYGFKIMIGNSSAETGEYLYKVYVSVKCSFRGQSDNSNQSIGTASFNHRVYAN